MQFRLIHIITALNTGGAETMLYKLLSGMDRERFAAQVVSLTDIGPIGEKVRALGVPVRALGMRRGVPDPQAVWRLARWLRAEQPHLVQTWMYHADLVGGLAAQLAGGFAVVWGIHHSDLSPEGNKRTTIWTAKACARLSHRLPRQIVCCSEASRTVHSGLGYAREKMVVIPNGFDLEAFRPDPAGKAIVRRELGLSENVFLIGLAGRFDPQKDHRNFVSAAARLDVEAGNVHFLLCGDGVTWKNAALAEWITAAGLQDRFHLLGWREDMPRLMAALDIASTSSAYGEAFPLVVGEAMACAVPCVVTDVVGDSAYLVGDTGRVVPPRDPEALAVAWQELITLHPEARRRLGADARRRVEEHFSLPRIVARYEALYQTVLHEARHTYVRTSGDW